MNYFTLIIYLPNLNSSIGFLLKLSLFYNNDECHFLLNTNNNNHSYLLK